MTAKKKIVDVATLSRYCIHCQHPVDIARIDSAQFDFLCPNCRLVSISRFYSVGSMTHKDMDQKYRDWVSSGLGLPSTLHRMPPMYPVESKGETT